MKVHNRVARTLSGLLAVLALVCMAEFTASATPPSGIAFTPIGRATVPEFDVRRRFLVPREDAAAGGTQTGTNKTRCGNRIGGHPIDQCGHAGRDVSAWRIQRLAHASRTCVLHHQNGHLTVYEGDDPSCTPLVFPAGTGDGGGWDEHAHPHSSGMRPAASPRRS